MLASFKEDKLTKREYSLYKIGLAKFKHLNQLLQSFYGAVIKTLDYKKTKDIVQTYLIPHELLVKLKKRLCPTAARFYAQLRKRYYALQDSDSKL
jgi:ribosomal protein S27AE